MNDVIEKQKEFQRAVGFPIDSIKEDDILEMGEKYIFKAIEELIELRKEFPSVMNPWSKDQQMSDRSRILEEFSDVLLFLINFANLWKFTDKELVDTIKFVQNRNFDSLKRKKLDQFNQTILKTPGYTIGIGQGNINPKYVFVGQNPGQGIPNGYKVWSDENDGSSKILLPALDKLGIRQDCYFTNLVKCTTPNNEEPNILLVHYWFPKLQDELKILMINNPGIKLVLMGNFVKKWMKAPTIPHPAYILRGGLSEEQYIEEIQNAIR